MIESESAAPTERQVLYALVAAGFLMVVIVLIVAAAAAGLVPLWWTVVSGLVAALVAARGAVAWRNTRSVLTSSILVFVVWTIGTLLLA